MKIVGMEGVSGRLLQQDIQQRAKFVVNQYCISILIVSFKRSSVVHYIRPDDNAALQGLKYTFLTLVLGWWGIPWGPIYRVQAIINNFQGGKDVTTEMMSAFVSTALPEAPSE